MNRPKKKAPWLVFRPRTEPAKLRLFCFPYAGGGASIYRTWASDLPAAIEAVPVQPPGRENRLMETPLRRMDDLANALVPELLPHLDRPFAFFGYSLGATLAYEVALRLQRLHGKPPAHLMVAARRAPHLPPSREAIHDLPEDAFIERLRELDGTPEEALANPELMELLLPLLRADFEVVETYEPIQRPAVATTVTALGGLADPDVEREHLEAWSGYGQEPFRVRMFPGGHFFLHDEGTRTSLIQAVIQELQPLL
ncbi:MAG: thioesterase domain-containing protein [Acidobacteriota bacterium]